MYPFIRTLSAPLLMAKYYQFKRQLDDGSLGIELPDFSQVQKHCHNFPNLVVQDKMSFRFCRTLEYFLVLENSSRNLLEF